MIQGFENVRDIFSIFHDGSIVEWKQKGSDIELIVEIQYLAERVCKSYDRFSVVLHNIKEISFETWPHTKEVSPWVISDIHEIFKPELEILSAETEEGLHKIICNQHSTEFEYCGGNLKFSCVEAEVKDQGGKEYSIEELDKICNEYWEAWAKGNENKA